MNIHPNRRFSPVMPELDATINIETRGEARKRKNREQNASKRADKRFRQAENEQLHQRMAKLRQREEYNKAVSNRSKARRKIGRNAKAARSHKAEEAGITSCVLDMDMDFEKSAEEHSNWPQPIQVDVARNALGEFRDMVSLNQLRELPCAVCSGLRAKDDWKKVSVIDIDLSLLKCPIELATPSFEIDFHYGHPYIDDSGLNVLLDRTGFLYPSDQPNNGDAIRSSNNPFDLRICNDCFKNLRRHKIPPLSLANNMWIGPTPPCLQDMTIPEQLLISPGYLCMNLVQLTKMRHTHHKLKGHIVTLPQNPCSLVKVLPLPMYRLCEYLKVVFVGQGTPTDRQLKKVLQVRKSKITAALRWLFKHNIMFKNHFEIDENALNDLPEGEIPAVLAATTTAVDLDPRSVEHYTGYTQDPSEKFNGIEDDDGNDDDQNDHDGDGEFGHFAYNNTVGSASELRPSGIVHVDNVPVSERDITLQSLQKLMYNTDKDQPPPSDSNNCHIDRTAAGSSDGPAIRMPHGNIPLNEYRDATLFPAGFPVLYPYGVGGHEGRSLRVSLKEYANHLMRHRDPKFRQHRSFPFVAFNILQRREISSQSYNLTRGRHFNRSAELIATLTPEDIKAAIDQEQNKESITNPAVLELLKNVNSAGSKLMASYQSRNRMRNEMRAITLRDGTPSLFITINPADLHSPIVMMYAGGEIDLDKLLPENFPKATERARLAHLHFVKSSSVLTKTQKKPIN